MPRRRLLLAESSIVSEYSFRVRPLGEGQRGRSCHLARHTRAGDRHARRPARNCRRHPAPPRWRPCRRRVFARSDTPPGPRENRCARRRRPTRIRHPTERRASRAIPAQAGLGSRSWSCSGRCWDAAHHDSHRSRRPRPRSRRRPHPQRRSPRRHRRARRPRRAVAAPSPSPSPAPAVAPSPVVRGTGQDGLVIRREPGGERVGLAEEGQIVADLGEEAARRRAGTGGASGTPTAPRAGRRPSSWPRRPRRCPAIPCRRPSPLRRRRCRLDRLGVWLPRPGVPSTA